MYIYTRKIVRKIITYLLTFNCYLISRKIITTSLVGIKYYWNNNATEKLTYEKCYGKNNTTEKLTFKL